MAILPPVSERGCMFDCTSLYLYIAFVCHLFQSTSLILQGVLNISSYATCSQAFLYYCIKENKTFTKCVRKQRMESPDKIGMTLQYYHIVENFRGRILSRIGEKQGRKLLHIAWFCHAKRHHAPKFCGENFRKQLQNHEIRESFLPRKFPTIQYRSTSCGSIFYMCALKLQL